jgi:phosphoglycerol transferase MdoB-like AlkP superfamily enzyme
VLALRANVKIKGIKWRIGSIAVTVFVSAVYLFTLNAHFDKEAPTYLKYERYNTYYSNKRFGMLPTFLYNLSNLYIQKPENYSKQAAVDIMNEQQVEKADNNNRPNIVVIMDESFSDLSNVYDIETSEPMLTKLHALSDNTVKGDMLVSVYGGNTCVTEFEFLTGITSGVFQDDTVAYTQCVRKPINSICNDLKNIGYKTIAIHPYWKNSWNRCNVYPLLGFDETIFAENFGTQSVKSSNFMNKPKMGDYEYLRGFLSDAECFKKVEEQFENKADDERLFVFNVTIQNHSAYTIKDFENEVSATNMNSYALNQYLTLVNKSDDAFADMVEYFKNYDEPTVIVYFGDHQPNIQFERNANEKYQYLSDDSKYIVPFAIWANYDIEEKDVEITSPAYLSLLLKDVADLPETKWDVFRRKLQEQYPAYTLREAYDNNKNAIMKDELSGDLYEKYKILQYGMIFDEVTP